MSLRYRAIWRDDRLDLIDTARSTFQEWLAAKGINLVVPSEGAQKSESHDVVVEHASDDNTVVLRIRLNEHSPVEGGEQCWTTTIHWLTHNRQGWIWADVEWVSDNAFSRPPEMAAPGLVHLLLEQRIEVSESSRIGPMPTRVGSGDVDALIEWILRPDRQLPVVVYSVDSTIRPEDYATRVQKASRRLAGCADVRMLTADSEPVFNESMRPLSLTVFDGAVRIYLPAIDRDDPQSWRHRYTTARHLSEDPYKAAGIVVKQLFPRMVALQPPEIYREKAKHLLDLQRHDWQAIAEELDEQQSRLVAELRDLQHELEEVQLDRDVAYEEATESEKRALRAQSKLDLLRSHMRIRADSPELVEAEQDDELTLSSCQEAILEAQALDMIAIHPNAPQEIERLDESRDAELWAYRIYRHLQALDSYAQEKASGFVGSFWEWCETSGNPKIISLKFVAMTESESVRKHEKLRSYRIFPIDPLVDPSGEILMFAHLKTVEGGGLTIPRIYFHDDTMKATKMIHVGFIGPHDLVPNKSAN